MFIPQNNFEGFYSLKGSRFIALGRPTETPNHAKHFIQELRENPDFRQAVHFCFAWQIFENGRLLERSSDDGEPAGTAGLPILRQLHSFDVVQTTLVVIRFFGGTLLGKPGLIESYREAAKDALNHATLLPFEEKITCFISGSFSKQRYVDAILKSLEAEISERSFDSGFSYRIRIKKKLREGLFMGLKNDPEIQLNEE